jgi:hypothetical protein
MKFGVPSAACGRGEVQRLTKMNSRIGGKTNLLEMRDSEILRRSSRRGYEAEEKSRVFEAIRLLTSAAAWGRWIFSQVC